MAQAGLESAVSNCIEKTNRLDKTVKNLRVEADKNKLELKGDIKEMRSDFGAIKDDLGGVQTQLAELVQMIHVLATSKGGDEAEGSLETHANFGKANSNPKNLDGRVLATADTANHLQLVGNQMKLEMPTFDGFNPRLWKANCERFFAVCQTPAPNWTATAALQFVGRAATWLAGYQVDHVLGDWANLTRVVTDKFGTYDYQNVMKEMFTLQQRGSVQEFYDRFEEQMYIMKTFNSAWDEMYFLTLFVQGLKPEIGEVVDLHMPATLERACELAKRQEIIVARRKGELKQFKTSVPSTQWNHSRPAAVEVTQKFGMARKEAAPQRQAYVEKGLYDQRRAQGLCGKCG